MKLTTTQAKLRATVATLSNEKEINAKKQNEIILLQAKLEMMSIEKEKLLNALNESIELSDVNYKTTSNIPMSDLENDFNINDHFERDNLNFNDSDGNDLIHTDEPYADMNDIYAGQEEAEFNSG